jgi:hypothetical protein
MNYKEIQTSILSLEGRVGEDGDRLRQTEKRLEQSQGFLDTLAERFKKAVLSDDEKAVKSLEIEAVRSQVSIKRDTALVEALKEEIEKMQSDLSSLKENRNGILASLARGWLREERKDYDKSARETLRRAKRLMSCYGILREIEQGHVYTEEVVCFEFFPSIAVPVIEGFDRSTFLSGSPFQGVSGGGREEVFSEVVGK